MRHIKRSAITAEVRAIRARLKETITVGERLRLSFRLAFLYGKVLQEFYKK